MTNKLVYLNEFTDKLASIDKFMDTSEYDNTESRKKIIKIIKQVAEGELTKRQRQCLFMHYQRDMKMSEISDSLGICVSCVSRHIKKAKARIHKTLAYLLLYR